jgi:hypothetical protein
MFVECPFCHQQVPKAQFAAHEQQHTQLLPDGQMQDHINLREEERYRGSLAKVPQVYEHKSCGGMTQMPEEVIRSYLADPFLYNDSSFCTGCNRYVPTQELFWMETGESVFRYTQNLRRDYLIKQGMPPQEIRYSANGTVLKPKKANSNVGCILAAVLGTVLMLGAGSLVAVVGMFWFIARPKAHPAMAPAPVIAASPAQEFDFKPHAAHLEDIHERMRKRQEEHRQMIDEMQSDMRRRHEEIRERMREQGLPGF